MGRGAVPRGGLCGGPAAMGTTARVARRAARLPRPGHRVRAGRAHRVDRRGLAHPRTRRGTAVLGAHGPALPALPGGAPLAPPGDAGMAAAQTPRSPVAPGHGAVPVQAADRAPVVQRVHRPEPRPVHGPAPGLVGDGALPPPHRAVRHRPPDVDAGPQPHGRDPPAGLPGADALPVPPVDRAHGAGLVPDLRRGPPVSVLRRCRTADRHGPGPRSADRRTHDEAAGWLPAVGNHRGAVLQVARAGRGHRHWGDVGPGRARAQPDGAPEAMSREHNRRVVYGLGIPVAAAVFIAAMLWGMSRILLAVDPDIAPLVAVGFAANILVASALAATLRGRRAFVMITAVIVATIVGGGIAGAVVGEWPVLSLVAEGDHPPGPPPQGPPTQPPPTGPPPPTPP